MAPFRLVPGVGDYASGKGGGQLGNWMRRAETPIEVGRYIMRILPFLPKLHLCSFGGGGFEPNFFQLS